MITNIKKAAVIGTGVIGSGWAARFLAAGLDVVAWDPGKGAEEQLRKNVANAWPALERVGLKPGASLINVGRGGQLVEPDLLAALKSGQLIAASLDVFSQEPLPADHPFWSHPRVFMTPHNASDTDPAGGLGAIAAQIERDRAVLPLEHVADRRRGY